MDKHMSDLKKLSLPQRITEIYLAALFFLLPLYTHNAYFDITEAKVGCFGILSALYILLMPFAELKSQCESPVTLPQLSFLLYVAVTVSASLLYMGRAALLSPTDRYQGVLMLGLYGLSFLYCSRHGSFGRWPQMAALCALVPVSLYALFQSFGFDPLGLWENIRPGSRGTFLSTIGNVDFLGAYFALLLPLCAGFYCQSRNRLVLPLFALSCCGLFCGSDGGMVGAAAGLWLLSGLVSGEEERHRSFGLLLAILPLSVFLYGLALDRFGLLHFSSLGRFLSAPYVALPAAVPGLLLWRRGKALRHPWLLPLSLCGVGLLGLLLGNLFPALVPVPLRDLVIFSESWGSSRGGIWRYCMDFYRSFTPLQKLIGGGSGCLAAYDQRHIYFPDAILDSAHNEYLHILLNGGALGLAAYLTALVSALKTGAKKRPAIAAAVFGCAVQASVNIAQCATTPLLLMLLAVLCQ